MTEYLARYRYDAHGGEKKILQKESILRPACQGFAVVAWLDFHLWKVVRVALCAETEMWCVAPSCVRVAPCAETEMLVVCL